MGKLYGGRNVTNQLSVIITLILSLFSWIYTICQNKYPYYSYIAMFMPRIIVF